MNNESILILKLRICHSICRYDRQHWSSVSQSLQICTNKNMVKIGARIDKQCEIGNFSILLLLNNEQRTATKSDLQDLCRLFFPHCSLLVLVQILGIMNKSILSYPKRNAFNSMFWALDIGNSNEVFNPIETQHNTIFRLKWEPIWGVIDATGCNTLSIQYYYSMKFVHRMQSEQFTKTEIGNFIVCWAVL